MTDSAQLAPLPPVRVLTAGDNQSFFVALLCREIKRRCPQCEFYICDYIQYGQNVGYDENATFAGQFKSPPVFEFNFKTLRAVAGALLSGHFYRRAARTMACFGLAGRSVIDAAARSLGKAVQIERFRNEIIGRQRYDIWHFQFCTPSSLRYLDIVPPAAKVVCSFWGSDLLRSAEIESYVPVFNALQRADAITVQTAELREFLLCKFGRGLLPKVHCCRFPSDSGAYQRMSALCRQGSAGRASARSLLGLPPDRTLVGIGHNGGPGDKHLEILEALEHLPSQVKSRLFLVFPMTYGLKAPYENAVKAACERSGFGHLILKEYLSREALAALRVAVDMAVYMPESDALSAAALETIYAGNTLLAGAWLPYGLYRRLGLPFIEVETHSQLAQVIPSLMDKPKLSDPEVERIQSRIESNFSADGTAPGWIAMYQSLMRPPPWR
ncbi:MAG TPA: hypothetical protein VGO59_10175 [Verrucomicrobiae bacterium]|jgi:hypothetical protein